MTGKRRRRGGRLRRLGWLVPVALGLAALGAGAAMLLWPAADNASLASLAERARAAGGAVDVAEAAREEPEARNWVSVPGASIDLPVAQATDDDPGHYLRHGLDGGWSLAGVPFVDHRTSGDATHVLAYGHHISVVGGGFSGLFDAWRQGRFDEVAAGGATWQTVGGGATRLAALCALEVDEGYAPIQTFAWGSIGEYRSWLRAIASGASARAADWEALAGSATRDVTLATCSSVLSGQPGRCLVVFVSTA